MLIEYNIYCDESCHLENDVQKIMALGAVWCPKGRKDEIFIRLRELKAKHGLKPGFELKWNKVSNTKLEFYEDIIDYFFDNEDLHFRVLIVPDKSILDHPAHGQTHDDFYYKMLFDLLKVIFDPKHGYNIYIDIKDTRSERKVEKLKEVLRNTHYDYSKSIVKGIQQVRSHEVELVQLADFMTGALSYVFRDLKTSPAKLSLIERIKKRSGYSLTNSTLYKEDKVNVFIWKSGKMMGNER
jgi:hypothetical protein